MGLLQNGFKDVAGVFRFYGAGLSNGALPQQLQANYALTGMRRNLTAGEGITDDKVGLPMGYLAGGSYQLPQKPGQLSSRAYVITVDGAATGVSGLPSSGSTTISIDATNAEVLPLDDTSPLRTASTSLEITASATGELRMSGSGSTSISVDVVSAALVGILEAVGSASIAISTNTPILGAEASGAGDATISMSVTASILPEDDTPPARTASATFSITGTLIPYAIGHMSGTALPYTELSPQSLANAVWQSPASENNATGTMGNKLNTASSGGVDLDALADAVLEKLQANQIPVNVKKMNDANVLGSGTSGDKWRGE